MDPLNVPYFHFRWVLKLLTSVKYHNAAIFGLKRWSLFYGKERNTRKTRNSYAVADLVGENAPSFGG